MLDLLFCRFPAGNLTHVLSLLPEKLVMPISGAETGLSEVPNAWQAMKLSDELISAG